MRKREKIGDRVQGQRESGKVFHAGQYSLTKKEKLPVDLDKQACPTGEGKKTLVN